VDPERDLIASVYTRLKAANLIPPISGVEVQGSLDDEWALVTLHGRITDELANRVRQALAGLHHDLREVPAEYGISYRQVPTD
jgi:hypothetical protein